METYVIEFVAWQMPSHFHDLLPIFYVYQSGEHHFLFAACARLGYRSARALRKLVNHPRHTARPPVRTPRTAGLPWRGACAAAFLGSLPTERQG